MKYTVEFTKAELNNIKEALYECLTPNRKLKSIFSNHLKRNSAANALDKVRAVLKETKLKAYEA